MQIEHIELRKNLRISINLDINYTTGGETATRAADKTGKLLDVSDRGAGLLLEEPFGPNQRLRLAGYSDWIQPRDCVVRWVRKANHHYRIGVEFEPDST